MNVKDVARVLEAIPADQPVTVAYLHQTASTRSPEELKAGILGWLDEYDTPGFYGRLNLDHDARHCYQHLHSALALLWIAEAVGVERGVLSAGVQAIRSTVGRHQTVAAAFRRVCPWPLVHARLSVLLPPGT